MLVEKAKNNYLGKNGGKMNCAQAVSAAFNDKFDLDDELVDLCKNNGSGRAPGGTCGAYYAGKLILEKNHKEMAVEFETYFLKYAGALECKNIRGLKKLSCVGCVEKSAGFLGMIGTDKILADYNPAE